ncbi:hypothetical protein TNCT_435371 [Trichonephila clavata]|uniref:Uncharacterized protein n=1 Tax=Trichonephila clavata TaxID=2740835 RepID=A0A8X6LHD4_TRICU|nr:hypothetical protein TNCT_435371 [Trichonephila clavata]
MPLGGMQNDKKKDDDITPCSNQFGALTVDDSAADMDVSDPAQPINPGPVGDHLTKECTKGINEPATCCLCGGDHPASYLQCPKNPKHDEKRRRKIKQIEGTVFTSPPPSATNAWAERSKAKAVKNIQKPPFVPRQIALAQAKAQIQAVQPQPTFSTSQSPQLSSSPIQDIPNLFAQLRDPEVIDLFNSLQTFIQIAKQHKTRSARLSAFFQYIYSDNIQ